MSTVHEDFTRGSHSRGGSDRNFGFVFAAAFLFLGLLPLRHGMPVRPVWLALSVVLVGIALLRPSLLAGPNRLWTALGIALGKVVNPVVTGLLFYLVFTPVAIVRRWMGKDPLALSFDPNATTYWVSRTEPEKPADMTGQF